MEFTLRGKSNRDLWVRAGKYHVQAKLAPKSVTLCAFEQYGTDSVRQVGVSRTAYKNIVSDRPYAFLHIGGYEVALKLESEGLILDVWQGPVCVNTSSVLYNE